MFEILASSIIILLVIALLKANKDQKNSTYEHREIEMDGHMCTPSHYDNNTKPEPQASRGLYK